MTGWPVNDKKDTVSGVTQLGNPLLRSQVRLVFGKVVGGAHGYG
jgi:hypothetical protein